MLLKTFTDSALAQVSYLLGCEQTGEALVIDPARDVQPYIDAAAHAGMHVVMALETHIHADFVSGLRELASRTGAHIALSDMGGPEWGYDFASEAALLLHDGDAIMIGTIRIDVLHTPGHAPEHLCFLFTDQSVADQPMGLFTGDCLFVGDVGRPDLLEAVPGIEASAEHSAAEVFSSIARLKLFPDYLMVLPGHGAGSACGKSLSAVPSTTLGYERHFNPAFQFDDATVFTRWLLSGQPETPRYFGHMKSINRHGPNLLTALEMPGPLEGFILPDALHDGVVIDARSADRYNDSHIPGAINIPAGEKFAAYAGWIVDYAAPTYLIADADAVPGLTRQLRAIGIDQLAGYFPPHEVEGTSDSLSGADPAEVASLLANGATLIDVRSAREYREGHIEGAQSRFYGMLADDLESLSTDGTLLVYCASGFRSQIAASLLERAGFHNVVTLRGGIDAWRADGYPVTSVRHDQ